ncbi:hypothetical protein GE253_25590 [Niveispirillum sp. SYP-B3756]|uniref:hypothetical protein n=1 Tax=Niveispirillum sp. SYP-B3756 TaxID=2662178 RepID=UPI001290DE8F|nr:hypothetical protein [Niveispirillum sp. SYP-B3756]MQP68677.1 hypothetical protein [Niveispirillum sp. SYP-B3756]
MASRAFLEPVWPSWHAERGQTPPVLSAWTCSRSSLFLQRVLIEDFGIAAAWMTGCPFDEHGVAFPAGFHSADGWLGHSWIVAGDLIVDITADQFGLAPVTVVSASDSRYRASEDLALLEFKAKRTATVDMLWPHWLSQKPAGFGK